MLYKIDYMELQDDIEKWVNLAYTTHFNNRVYMKDDLLQEARLLIWKNSLSFNGSVEVFKSGLFITAQRAMLQFINKRYHLRSKTGYIEDNISKINEQELIAHDYTLKLLLLLYDVRLLTKKLFKKVRNKENYYKLVLLVLGGYSHQEMSLYLGYHEDNIYAKLQILGRNLIMGWKI